jgi:hypothetical protein
MTEFYKFAGEHPFLTFLLAVIIGETILYTIQSIASIFKK